MVNQKFRYASTLGQDHLSQRWRDFTFMGPHNNFFRKNIRYSKYRDTLTYGHDDDKIIVISDNEQTRNYKV